MDAERDALAVGLLAGDTLDVHDVLETVDAGDLALAAFVGAPQDGDFVVLADGYRADLERSFTIVRLRIFSIPFVACSVGLLAIANANG